MMGSVCIDLSLKNIWETWWRYRKGKKFTDDLYEFLYFLEQNLFELSEDLTNGSYQHDGYQTFVVTDNKKREISVASIRDRVVHRLVYDYLNALYDKTFIFDAWSCRLGKGLLGGIERAQSFLKKHPRAIVWKMDVKKFFDSVDHQILRRILSRKVTDTKALHILGEIIGSYRLDKSGGRVAFLSEICRAKFSPIFT